MHGNCQLEAVKMYAGSLEPSNRNSTDHVKTDRQHKQMIRERLREIGRGREMERGREVER